MSAPSTSRVYAPDTPADAYIELVKQCVTRALVPEDYRQIRPLAGTWTYRLYEPIRRILARWHFELVRNAPLDARTLAEGRGFSAHAETMVGLRRLDTVKNCVIAALSEGVPGDLVETGVWRGGTVIFMRAILHALGETDRRVWVADSFQGLPQPDASRWPADAGNSLWAISSLAISQDEVERNFARYGLLDDQVRFLPGWFEETLPTAPIERVAVLRLDGDMYGSTMATLQALYPRVSPGGYVIVDDYGAYAECRQATDDYRLEHGIETPIEKSDWTGIWWRKDPVGEGPSNLR